METMPQNYDQLPPPSGQPVPLEQLGNLPVDPTIQIQNNELFNEETISLIGPDGYIFNVTKTPPELSVENQSPLTTELPEVNQESRVLVDTGALDFAPIGKVVDSLKVSYHGLRYSISKNREYRAKDRQESKSLHKSSRKAHDKKLIAEIVATGYTSKANQGGLTKSEKRHEMHVIKTSDMSRDQKALAIHKLDSRRVVNHNTGQSAVNGRAARANFSHNEKVNRPIVSSVRRFRANRSQARVAVHQARAAEHLQKAIDIRQNRP